jgi:soluble lytic murein transglycosylase
MSIRGAQGYMQLMPRTAKEIAKSIKIKFSLNALIENPSLNIRLGAKYLEQLIVKYKGSYVLAIAAYNAGPSNVKRWIKNNGDPRKIDINIIDWIERIPFHETRNYVQRVLENLHIYRTLLKTPASFTDPRIYWRPLRRNMGS